MRHQPDASSFDASYLAERVRQKRGDVGLRAAAKEIGGISASTLGRMEKGQVPDLDTFIRLCRWLGANPNQFMKGVPGKSEEGEEASTPDVIAAHFRADRALEPQTAESLAATMRALYEAAIQGKI